MEPPANAQEFGKYTLIAKLATGGMAEIFLARLLGAAGFEKLVCIKRILPHLAADTTFTSMFLAEASIVAQISHPNVCQVFELGELDGRYYIAMEYLEGMPFAGLRSNHLHPTPTDPRLVAGLVMQACEGLHHAHNLKRSDGSPLHVVHRDVTTNNLFVTSDGVAKVLDFGIAKCQDAPVKTSTGVVKGTHSYLAPEQLRGQPLDRRVDVFAMGIVTWELLARRSLFKRDTDFLTYEAILLEPIPALTEVRPDTPPALSAVIARALSRKPDQRHPTTRALGEAIGEAVAPLGGALTPAAIARELERAFETTLREQRRLLQSAQVSNAASVQQQPTVLDPPLEAQPPRGARPPTETTAQGQPRDEGAPPTRPRRSSGGIAALATLGLSGGGALLYWSSLDREPARPVEAVLASPSAPAPSPSPPARSLAPSIAPSVAPSITPSATAAPTSSKQLPEPAAPSPGAKSERRRRSREDRTGRQAPREAQRSAEPAGFITIDSSPVYAEIYVDGKHRGETPLVRLAVAPGVHTVRAVAPSGSAQTFSISIESGKVAETRRITW